MILVTGATGNVGSELARQLLARGIGLKAYGRDPDRVEQMTGLSSQLVVSGDFRDSEAWKRAVENATALYLVTNETDDYLDALPRLLAQAIEGGIGRVVVLSALGDPQSEHFFIRRHGEIDDIVRSSGLPATILAPDWFMQNFDHLVHDGRISFPAGQGKTSFVDVRDVAELAILCLLEAGHQNRTYRPTGPEQLSFGEVAAKFSSQDRKVEFVDLNPEDFINYLISAGVEPWRARMQAGMTLQLRVGLVAPPSNDIPLLLGRKARSFDEYLLTGSARHQP